MNGSPLLISLPQAKPLYGLRFSQMLMDLLGTGWIELRRTRCTLRRIGDPRLSSYRSQSAVKCRICTPKPTAPAGKVSAQGRCPGEDCGVVLRGARLGLSIRALGSPSSLRSFCWFSVDISDIWQWTENLHTWWVYLHSPRCKKLICACATPIV